MGSWILRSLQKNETPIDFSESLIAFGEISWHRLIFYFSIILFSIMHFCLSSLQNLDDRGRPRRIFVNKIEEVLKKYKFQCIRCMRACMKRVIIIEKDL